jgi:hypothetical protein
MIRKIVRAVALLVLSSAATLETRTTTAIIGTRVIDGTGAPARHIALAFPNRQGVAF